MPVSATEPCENATTNPQRLYNEEQKTNISTNSTGRRSSRDALSSSNLKIKTQTKHLIYC
jgi:hypothetical protein